MFKVRRRSIIAKEKKKLLFYSIFQIFCLLLIFYNHPDIGFQLIPSFFQTSQNLILHLIHKLKLKKISWENCKLCNFTVRNTNEDSTTEDVIIGCAINSTENIILFMRTLRTTGCKAKCVLLMDQNAVLSLSRSTMKCVHDCGGQIINCGVLPVTDLRDCQNYVYLLCYEFLYFNRPFINRVIIVDLFDTVFQGDPFNFQVGGYYLNIINEGSDFTSSNGEVNEKWMNMYDFDLPDELTEEKYLCTGYIGGDFDVVYNFLHVFLQYMSLGKEKTDQGEVNFLYFSGILEKYGIHVVPERVNELVRHTAHVRLTNYERIGEVRTMHNKKMYAGVIHHYYCNPYFIYDLYSACPRGNYDKNYYISHCDTECLDNMEKDIHKAIAKNAKRIETVIDPDSPVLDIF